jgi:ParB/RepB/Spo0J family partition protein
MGKINLANISTGMNKVKSITDSLENLSHAESVPADLIHPADDNPYALSDTEESLNELAQSIKANGLINPLTVNKISDTEYRLISGKRRFKAISEYIHWKNIPCMVYDNISLNAAKLKLHAANLDVREYTTAQKLQFYEETDRLLRSMKESGEYTGPIQQGIAELLGVSDRQVRKYKTISENLPAETRSAVVRGDLSINDAARIATQQATAGSSFTPENSEAGTSSGSQPGAAGGISPDTGNEQTDDSDASDFDHAFWDEKIRTAIKQHYDRHDLYRYYVFHVPTTQEAIKETLKPDYGYSGGTVDFPDGTCGDIDARSQKITIRYARKELELSYSQVDSYVRQMIRADELLSHKEMAKEMNEYMTKRK